MAIRKARPRYIRLTSTSSGSSATQGPHQVAQRLMSTRFLVSFLTSLAIPSASIGSSLTGSASALASHWRALSRLSAHLVEQPGTRVVSTATAVPPRIASTALIASWDLTALTSESSNRPW